MDFALTEQQIMMQRMAREFAQKEIKPMARELDAKSDPRECIPWELYKKADELGLRTLGIPEELGGAGEVDWLTELLVTEELAAGDYTCAGLMGGGRILAQLNKEARDEFIPKFLNDYRYIIAVCRTEPNHGCDQFVMYDNPNAPPEVSIQTLAQKKGNEYVINGAKQFASNSGVASLFIVCCRIHKTDNIKDCETYIMVPRDTPGVTVGNWMDKLGRRLLSNAELFFDDVHVPTRYLVGREGGVWKDEFELLPSRINSTQAGVIGVMRNCYEETLEYARNRIQGGKRIIEHPTIALNLSKMRAAIEAARALVWKCAWSYKVKEPGFDPMMGWAVKAYVNRAALDIVNMAVEMHGGLGIDKSLPIEKYLRDVYSILHGFSSVDMSYIRGAPK